MARGGRRGITGPPPKPSALRKREGNLRKHAINEREPMPPAQVQVPDPPEVLGPRASDEWRRLAPILLQVGCLTKLDLAALTAYCAAFARWWTAETILRDTTLCQETEWGLKANPHIKIAREALNDMLAISREFGFTPAARSRIISGAALPGGDKGSQEKLDEAECFDP